MLEEAYIKILNYLALRKIINTSTIPLLPTFWQRIRVISQLWQELFNSLPFVFLVSLATALLLYSYGGRISPKVSMTPAKLTSYACGEDVPSEKLQINVERFFIYAVYFLVFDILAFMLATSLMSPGLMPAVYATITLLAVVFLLPMLKIRMS